MFVFSIGSRPARSFLEPYWQRVLVAGRDFWASGASAARPAAVSDVLGQEHTQAPLRRRTISFSELPEKTVSEEKTDCNLAKELCTSRQTDSTTLIKTWKMGPPRTNEIASQSRTIDFSRTGRASSAAITFRRQGISLSEGFTVAAFATTPFGVELGIRPSVFRSWLTGGHRTPCTYQVEERVH